MRAMKNIVILISGRGSNMQAIVRAARTEQWSCRIAAVISNRADAEGLAFAAEHGIPTAVVVSKGQSREAFDAALQAEIDRFAPDLVVLAGFMRVLKPGFLGAFAGRIINLHPSLLPSFPGLDAIGQAWKRGVKVTGCTVHYVTAEVDGGPIIDQAAVRLEPGDTLETLTERVHAAEHALLPAVLARLSASRN